MTDTKADRKRREPWRDYPRIDRRLHDWANWLHADTPAHIGWSVYTGDADNGLRVQLRNDCYADPVAREIEMLTAAERRNWITNRAVAALPDVWRAIVWMLYIPPRRPTYEQIAEAVGVRRQATVDHVLWALSWLDREIYRRGIDNLSKHDVQNA